MLSRRSLFATLFGAAVSVKAPGLFGKSKPLQKFGQVQIDERLDEILTRAFFQMRLVLPASDMCAYEVANRVSEYVANHNLMEI